MPEEMKLFGKPIAIKAVGCNHGDCPGEPIPPYVNLFVKVTNGCNARCAFCSNAGTGGTAAFNENKLFHIIDELMRSPILVHRINITGGEPASVPQRVERILERMEDKAYSSIHLHLNTNGLLSSSQALMRHPRWDSISVSLHHYDYRCLSEIYDTAIPVKSLCFDGIDRMKVNASCNLIKGYIDRTEEAHRMMDFCLERGIPRLGFVGLMPVNDYCRRHLVPLNVLRLEDIPHCYFTEARNQGNDCQCSNFLYNSHLRVLDIYMRHYVNPRYCESSLVFDGEFLRQGFHSENIIY